MENFIEDKIELKIANNDNSINKNIIQMNLNSVEKNKNLKQKSKEIKSDFTNKNFEIKKFVKESYLTKSLENNIKNISFTNKFKNEFFFNSINLKYDKINDSRYKTYLQQNEIFKNSFNIFRMEFKRLGFDTKFWRYTFFNKNFTLCSTYPPYFIVPTQYLDEDLIEVGKFRHIGRIPSVVWRYKKNGAVIIRSSQPSVGLLGRRSIEDENLLKMIFTNCIQEQAENNYNKNENLSNSENKLSLSCENLNFSCCSICKNNVTLDKIKNIEESNKTINEKNEEQSSLDSLNYQMTVKNSPSLECSCNCHNTNKKQTNYQSTQSSKFFSLSDKIIENIMNYTTIYNDNNNTSSNKKLLILDARSFTVAFFNRAMGGGSECTEYYPNCEVDYLYLANIHSVRAAFFSLKSIISSDQNLNYFGGWSKCTSNYWLYYISNLIESALRIVNAIDLDAKPILVHCSDGWDRTPQIVSLAELMLDSFYRTINGFKVLVQREWLDFGHKFADRCGVCPVSKNVNERSPIFLQWLDCVYQLNKQCPDYFEFNCTYLEELAFYTYSPLFGTFSCNSYLERFINQIHGETTSVWAYLEKSKDKFLNKNFIDSDKVLRPSYLVSDMIIWKDLYQNLITEEFESRFDIKSRFKSRTQTNNNFLMCSLLDFNQLNIKKIYRTFSSDSLCRNNKYFVNRGNNYQINLRKVKSESSLIFDIKKKLNIKINLVKDLKNNELNINFKQTKILKKQLNESELQKVYSNQNSFLQFYHQQNQTNSPTNSNGQTCKIESKTNSGFLNNCDSEIFHYQVPLSVISKIAQLANGNPESSLMYSILTYVNTLHTFSVK